MNRLEISPPRLGFRRGDSGVLVVEIAGNWLERSTLPDVATVEKELADRATRAVEFEATALGGWDSALMVRIVALHELCQKANVEFRAATLPAGLAKLIALAQAVPEKKDAARRVETPSFLQRVGESGLETWTGGKAMLGFLGENVLALLKLVRGQAQFRGIDMLQVMQECGPRALGIVALINFLICPSSPGPPHTWWRPMPCHSC